MPAIAQEQAKRSNKVLPSAFPHENGSSLLTTLKPHDMCWKQAGGGATESQTWYMALSDGGFVLLQTAYATIGLSPSVQYQIRYTNGDTKIGKSSSASGSAMKLSKDKCSYKLNDKNYAQMTVSDDGLVYDVKVGVTNDFVFEFKFKSSLDPCQIKEGKSVLGTNGNVGYVFHRFVPYGEVEGKMILPNGEAKDFSGSAVLVHALQSAKPHQIATKWDFFVQLDARNHSSLIFCQFITPSSLDKLPVSLGIFVEQGKLQLLSTQIDISYEGFTQDQSGYNYPTTKKFHMLGKDLDGADVEIKAVTVANNLFERVDILGDLPYLIRTILQALIAKPFSFMWFDEASVYIKRNGEENELSSHNAYHEITFINDEK